MNYGKLVRDKIPDIIRADGEEPEVIILADEAYEVAIDEKFVEEAIEVRDAKTPEQKLEELADVDELIDARLQTLGKTREDLEKVKKLKAQKRGAFLKRYFLVSND